MKRLLLLMLLLPGFTLSRASGIVNPPVNPAQKSITLQEFLKLTPKEYEKLTGKKLRFKQKIGLKIYQWKLRKKMANSEITPEQKKQGRLSLLLGIVSIVCLFIPVGVIVVLGLGCAIAGFVLGIKSLKGNSNTMGIIGLVLSSLTIFFFMLALIYVASWGWI